MAEFQRSGLRKKKDEVAVTSRLLNLIFEMSNEQQLDLLDTLDQKGCKGARQHSRKILKKPWIVALDPATDTLGLDVIRDISRCGMFIETKRSFSPGENVALTFRVPSSQKLFRLQGEIVRFQKNGIGVKFVRRLSTQEESSRPFV